MNYDSFDFNIESHVKKLIEVANARLPNRIWNITVVYCEDFDFEIALQSSLDGNESEPILKKDMFVYKKFENRYTHYLLTNIQPELWNVEVKEEV